MMAGACGAPQPAMPTRSGGTTGAVTVRRTPPRLRRRQPTGAAADAAAAGGFEASGLGLGFFIAKTLLERSGATLDFENRAFPERGAVVRVRWERSDFEQRVEFAS